MTQVRRTQQALTDFVAEAKPGPWRREEGVAPNEEEHVIWLTNDDRDSLIIDADDAARLVNAILESEDAA